MKICKCGSTKITHEEKVGRSLPPKSYNSTKLMPAKRITWKGIWYFYTCKDCVYI